MRSEILRREAGMRLANTERLRARLFRFIAKEVAAGRITKTEADQLVLGFWEARREDIRLSRRRLR